MLGTLFRIVGKRVAFYYGSLCCISVATIVAPSGLRSEEAAGDAADAEAQADEPGDKD